MYTLLSQVVDGEICRHVVLTSAGDSTNLTAHGNIVKTNSDGYPLYGSGSHFSASSLLDGAHHYPLLAAATKTALSLLLSYL